MSLTYNDLTTYKGVIQLIEKETKLGRGTISGDTDLLKEFTADVNSTLDDFTALAINSSGTWQWDDSNQTDYPIIKTNIVSGQRDYPFTVDGSNNLILDVFKVLILPSATSTIYQEIYPVDQQSESSTGIATENGVTGIPSEYDKTGNSIQFADVTPNYNATNGIKMLVNREASYFAYSDISKKAGIPGIFHEYLALKPALKYAGRNSLANYQDLLRRVIEFEGDIARNITGSIERYFSSRSRDERDILTMKRENNFR